MSQIGPPALGGSLLSSNLIRDLKEKRKKKYNKLSGLSYDIFMSKTNASINKINLTGPISDSKKCLKYATKIYIYMKLRKDYFSNFFSTLENLVSNDINSITICSFVQSKIMKIAPHGFFKNVLLNFDTNGIRPPIFTAYLSYYLITKASSSVLLCNHEYIMLICSIIFHPDLSARLIAFDSLNTMLKILENLSHSHLQSFNLLFYRIAQGNLYSQNISEQHGSFLLFGTIFRNINSLLLQQSLELIDFFISVLTSPQLRQISLYNIVLLSKYDKELFISKYADLIFDELFIDITNKSVSILTSHTFVIFYFTFSETTISKYLKLIAVFENLVLQPETITYAYQIIHDIAINFPFFIHENPKSFKNLFLNSLPFADFIPSELVDLITRFPTMFDSDEFTNAILVELQRNKTPNVLKFLSLCPSLHNPNIEKRLLFMLSNPDPKIRSKVPFALLAQISYEDPDYLSKIFHKIFSLALSDPNPTIRAQVVSAFNIEPCYKFLTLQYNLEPLTTLAHDISFEVRDQAIQLLGKISEYDPFNVLVILKQILLTNMQIIDIKNLTQIKSQTSRALRHIFESCKEILPVYTPTFCDIALRELSNMPTGNITYFEQTFSDEISLNITKAIRFIAKTDIIQLNSRIQQFVNFFTWRLQQNITKELELSIIKTLYIILTKSAPIKGIDLDGIVALLMGILTKSTFNQLNMNILKLVGFIGISTNPNIDLTHNSMIYNEQLPATSPNYYLSCACSALLGMLNDESLSSLHISCLKALSTIFSKDSEMFGEEYFIQFMPLLIEKVRTTGSAEYVDILNQTCGCAPLYWISMYQPTLLSLTQEMLEIKKYAATILDLIPTLCRVFKRGVESLFENCIALIYDMLENNMIKELGIEIANKSFKAIVSLIMISETFDFISFDKFIRILMEDNAALEIKYKAIDAIILLIQQRDTAPYSTMIIHSLCTIISNSKNDPKLFSKTMIAFYSIMVKNHSNFSYYANHVTSIIESQKRISKTEKDNYYKILQRSPPFQLSDFSFIQIYQLELSDSKKSPKQVELNTQPIDDNIIKASFSMKDEETPWNWNLWYLQLVYTIISLSPSPYISACAFLCTKIFTTAEKIFGPAFLSVWQILSEDLKSFISTSISRALLSESLPNYVCSSIITLLDFLERNECYMMISTQIICKACEKCSQYSNALYFASKWVYEEPNNMDANETIIRISAYFNESKLKKGLAISAQKRIDIDNSPQWFESIGEWSKAREIYEKEGYVSNFANIMKCLSEEKMYNKIISKYDIFESLKPQFKQLVSKFFLLALSHRRQFGKFKDILPFCPQNSFDVCLIKAFYYNSEGKKEESIKAIEKAFSILATNTTGLINPDLNDLIIKSEQAHEAIEIISSDTEDNERIQFLWEQRLERMPKNFECYYQLLSLRNQIFELNIDSNIKYIIRMLKYALKEEKYAQYEILLNDIFPDRSQWPAVTSFLNCKFIRKTKGPQEAIKQIEALLKDQHFVTQIENDPKLKSRVYFFYAQWLFDATPVYSVFVVLKDAVNLLEISMRTKIRYYNSFHQWALSCSLMYFKSNHVPHAVSAIHGFLECNKLKNNMQFGDIVQIINLFFKANLEQKSFDEISQRIGSLKDSAFLMIIPQLFAQITSNENSLQSQFVFKLLMKLLPNHFHIILHNLLFYHSPNKTLINLLNWFSTINSTAVTQSIIIHNGLTLSSSTSLEYWIIDIPKAISAAQKNNFAQAAEILNESLNRPQQPGETETEENIRKSFQSIIQMLLAKRSMRKASSADSLVSTKIDIDDSPQDNSNENSENVQISMTRKIIRQLKNIYSNLKAILRNTKSFSLHVIAPELFLLRNSVICVPGTYHINKTKVLIKQFDPTLEIYNSKQRPRFLIIYGNDGSKHKSLLKGREDLRLDSRLMQFFKLINQHIEQGLGSFCKKYRQREQATIFRYAITPISKLCGLISFVDGADTMFSLISDYRQMHSINVFSELDIETAFAAPNIDSMTPIQRLEAMQEAISRTSDDDLRHVMWLKSPSSTVWIRRIAQFAQSSAVMSIVGYVLGIGDRHPSNIMIHRYTGKVIHIDFGDSFEVSMKRKFFPEKIPFRLTRMMIKAFGPAGYEGDFGLTCEETLKMMRFNVYSIMSVLDIFMQEPLEDPIENYPKNSTKFLKQEYFTQNAMDLQNERQNISDSSSKYDDYTSEEVEEYEEKRTSNIRDSIKRINEKIMGKDYISEYMENLTDNTNVDKNCIYSIEKHVSFLIRNATDEYNLAYLYHGWTPLW